MIRNMNSSQFWAIVGIMFFLMLISVLHVQTSTKILSGA